MSMLRSTIVRRCRADVGTVEGVRRYAQAARLAAESDPDGGGPSNPPKQRGEAEGSGEGGRGRDYRFPTVGRRGGPPDPFEVLGLDRSADPSEVKRQYYRLALLLHPDSAHPSSSHDNFATLHRAYTLLSKPRSRTMYLSHGYGWGASHSSASASEDAVNWADARMRAEVRMRREGGAAAWHGGSGSGWAHSHAHARDFGYDSPLHPGGAGGGTHGGKGEERFTSNRQFLILTGGVSLLLAVGQYHRIGVYAEKHQDLLHQQHLDASHALAQARQEAAAFGKERRDKIRRRVREAQVIRETEEMERRGGSWERSPEEQSEPL